jgi:hypothetical protein
MVRNVNKKMFREWYSDPERHGEFTHYLLEFLS